MSYSAAHVPPSPAAAAAMSNSASATVVRRQIQQAAAAAAARSAVHHHHPPQPTALHNFIGGATGLSFAFAVMHPLDTIKTRMQAAPAPGAAAAESATAATASSSVGARIAATARSVFSRRMLQIVSRGFVASVAGAAPQGGLRLSSYEATKARLAPYLPDAPTTVTTLSALVGDLASSLVKVPREVITARLQTNYYGTAPMSGTAVAQRIVRDEGPAALWRGFGPIVARDAPFMVILFVSYETFKARYQVHVDSEHIPTGPSVLFGGVSGALAGFSTTPLDVLRTRVMTAKPGVDGQRPRVGIVGGLQQIYKEGGVRGLYRGSVARGTWWLCVCSMFFPIYEATKMTAAEYL
ncbi:hypothetical protein GGF32_004082 [Allomyces javanicus]|nr:hypothetical protein GGF32_004082 [Allomyces javanicus]